MTIFEPAGGPRLELPEEPTQLKEELRDAFLAGHSWRDGFSDDVCIGVWLWARWRPALEPAGCSRDLFVDAVVAHRREIWLWLVGERPWDELVTGLAGRVLRRMPAVSAG